MEKVKEWDTVLIPWLSTTGDHSALETMTTMLGVGTVPQLMVVHGGIKLVSTPTPMENMYFILQKMEGAIHQVLTGFAGIMVLNVSTSLKYR